MEKLINQNNYDFENQTARNIFKINKNIFSFFNYIFIFFYLCK